MAMTDYNHELAAKHAEQFSALMALVRKCGDPMGLAPGGELYGAHRISSQLSPDQWGEDWRVADAVENLQREAPHLFANPQAEPAHKPKSSDRKVRVGRQVMTAAAAMKLHPRVRLSLIAGDTGARL